MQIVYDAILKSEVPVKSLRFLINCMYENRPRPNFFRCGSTALKGVL